MLLILGLLTVFVAISFWWSTFVAVALLGHVFIIWQFIIADADLALYFLDKWGPDIGPKVRGRVVWVTGASRGIGAALCQRLARSGARLVLSARDEVKLNNVKQFCIAAGASPDSVLVLPLDMTQHEQHEPALQTVLKHFGELSVLVSNAGRTQRARWDAIETSVDKDLFELNVFSLVALARTVNRHFRENGGGQHVVMSSTAGKLGAPLSASYTGSKHALHGYFECLRLEGAAHKISVTMLCPGPVETDLLEHSYTHSLQEKPELSRRSCRLMSVTRCAELSLTAMAYGLPEVWICEQPVLLLHYVTQYCPALPQLMMRVAGVDRVMKLRDGHTEVPQQ